MKQDLNGVRTPEDVMRRLADNVKITSDEVSGLTIEVSKKVGDDEIISKINQSPESITLDANKININGVISANGAFSVDLEGNMKCRGANMENATLTGYVESNEGKIGGWIINNEGLSNSAVHINSDGSSTIYTVADLVIMRGYIMGYTGFEMGTSMIQHYDLNGDGVVNSLDYILLQQLIGISMND